MNVGRGQTDSIHTNSTVYRSEFLYDLTTAILLSEATSLKGPRNLVGMRNTDESRAFLSAAVTELTKIIETPAAPIKIDLAAHGLRDQMETNTLIEAFRARQTEAMRRQARKDAATGNNLTGFTDPKQLPDATE